MKWIVTKYSYKLKKRHKKAPNIIFWPTITTKLGKPIRKMQRDAVHTVLSSLIALEDLSMLSDVRYCKLDSQPYIFSQQPFPALNSRLGCILKDAVLIFA